MRRLVIAFMMAACAVSCNAQQDKKVKAVDQTATPGENKPYVNSRVNKVYDEKGNLIGYDSTYVWSYSSNGKTQLVDPDSVLAAFRKNFDTQFPSFFNYNFGNQIWNDSLFFRDFLSPDYFMQRWQHNFFDMRKLMQGMDSMRNDFLQKNYPHLQRSERAKLNMI